MELLDRIIVTQSNKILEIQVYTWYTSLIERILKRKHLTDRIKEIKQPNSKMVPRWWQPCICYLAIKLGKFMSSLTNCKVQILQIQLYTQFTSLVERILKRKHLTDLIKEIKQPNSKMVPCCACSHAHVIQRLSQENLPNVQLDKL